MSLRQKVNLPFRVIRSAEDVRTVSDVIRTQRPDVLHLHNPYPLISPRVVHAATDAGVAVVQTVHNFRHVCANGMLFRDGAPCRDCVGRTLPLPAVRHGCYQGSSVRSAFMATGLVTARSAWQRVSRFLALTDFHARVLGEIGLPPERITVRPTGLTDPGVSTSSGTGFLFVGRLDTEKGVTLLLDAWRRASVPEGWTLEIVGDGPMRAEVAELAAADGRVTWHGLRPADEVDRLLRAAGVVVVPSTCYEGQPRVVLEALARGRPLVFTDHGALPGVVGAGAGWGVPPAVDALARALSTIPASADVAARGAAARKRFVDRYTEEQSLRSLVAVYAEVTA
jgi:glycosyltransferase involved in cell wall biosynthesis